MVLMIHLCWRILDKPFKPERLTAFALASEVCASNFNISSEENKLLNSLKQKWDIPKTVVSQYLPR